MNRSKKINFYNLYPLILIIATMFMGIGYAKITFISIE